MKKLRFQTLSLWNSLLVLLVALLGVGCASRRDNASTDNSKNQVIRQQQIICMYGVPREILENRPTTVEKTESTDTEKSE